MDGNEAKYAAKNEIGPESWRKWPPFSEEAVQCIFKQEIEGTKYEASSLAALERHQYLERYLWPNFNGIEASWTHFLSIVIMINEKMKMRLPAWSTISGKPELFSVLFLRACQGLVEGKTDRPYVEKCHLIRFLIHCYESLEHYWIRKECLKWTSLGIWRCLLQKKREEMLKKLGATVKKHWDHIEKQYADNDKKALLLFQHTFLSRLIRQLFRDLTLMNERSNIEPHNLYFVEYILEWLIDLESQLPTRRYVNTLIIDHLVFAHCQKSALYLGKLTVDNQRFVQLYGMLRFYVTFEVDDFAGKTLSQEESIEIRYERIAHLQRIAFGKGGTFRDIALLNPNSLEKRGLFEENLSRLSRDELIQLCLELNFRHCDESDQSYDPHFIKEILLGNFEVYPSQIDMIKSISLYPDENVLWNPLLSSLDREPLERALPFPKMGLQYLTMLDYLLRSFNLYRLESVMEVREDVMECVRRLNPILSKEGDTTFKGFTRMALPLKESKIILVGTPRLGETAPSLVLGELRYSHAGLSTGLSYEWDALRPHDYVFILNIQAIRTSERHENEDDGTIFNMRYGISHVRGAEIIGFLNDRGDLIDEKTRWDTARAASAFHPHGLRIVRVHFDPHQYKIDREHFGDKNVGSFYSNFNVMLRRKPHENVFKAVLETIRDLMQCNAAIPEWLQDVFLGYGNPSNACRIIEDGPEQNTIDIVDTFLDKHHLMDVLHLTEENLLTSAEHRFFTLKIPPSWNDVCVESSRIQDILATGYSPKSRGPYESDIQKHNRIRFTLTQVKAILSAMHTGLTLIVGPPGTGKTDVAVQIISNLYHNFPHQKMLIITHSNHALNQLFEKLLQLDVPERYFMRLGHGEEELDNPMSFGKYGRVHYLLERRISLLGEVERLAKSLDIQGDHAYSCENACNFFRYHVQTRWSDFEQLYNADIELDALKKAFPFSAFFSDVLPRLFGQSASRIEIWSVIEGCYRHICSIFQELEEILPLELFKSNYERANYVLAREAKIVAMTCTHAALKRRELLNLKLRYETVIFEEAAQLQEIESFIPLMLQNPEDESNNGKHPLRRVVMIGDHHQLSPIIKSIPLQKHCNLEQSMFARFIRLGIPYIELNAQGRARSSIVDLYRWRYQKLYDLPFITSENEFLRANVGFAFEYQLIDVPDYLGKGETQPTPHFYQNLGEAEYMVALYQFMRLVGYPAEKITMLATYNGQKHLIREVLEHRCSWNPFFGRPRIATVDTYQGQQNDYILLSLVRTKSIGHLRDIRRLIVAMSRARLGLYIFCRSSLFSECLELSPTFDRLLARPTKLHLVLGESFPCSRSINEQISGTFVVENVVHMGQFVIKMTQEHADRSRSEGKADSRPFQEIDIDEDSPEEIDN